MSDDTDSLAAASSSRPAPSSRRPGHRASRCPAPDASPRRSALPADPFAPNAFLRIGTDDTVTVLLAHSEMGQGIWTALPMLIAEELDADWSKIRVEHAPAAPAYAHTAFGMQMTGGSTSTWSEFDRYRQAGATARAMLSQAAAERFNVEPLALPHRERAWSSPASKRARYGELAEAAAQAAAAERRCRSRTRRTGRSSASRPSGSTRRRRSPAGRSSAWTCSSPDCSPPWSPARRCSAAR